MKSQDITSVTEHRQHLRDHINQVKETGRPMFVTSGGTAEAVVLSPQAYDALIEEVELARSVISLDESMQDVKAGRTRPMRDALKEMIEEFGGKLDA